MSERGSTYQEKREIVFEGVGGGEGRVKGIRFGFILGFTL